MWLIAFLGLGIFLLSIFLIKKVIKFCNKYSLYDSVSARKIHSGNIPRLGGIAIFVSFISGCVVYFLITDSAILFTKIPLLISCSIIFAVGILDDLFDLKAYTKLLAQLVATGIVVFFGYRFQSIFGVSLNTSIFGRIFSSIFTYFWVVGIINSYNLIDGLDGLCSTLALSVLITVALIYSQINTTEAMLCIFLCAGILGFLVFNFPPAKIFMGDNGSQFLGFMIAILPLYVTQVKNTSFEFNKVLVCIVLSAIPMTDTIASIWRRIRDKRPIMSPDKAHLHHKLLNIGLSKNQVLLVVDLVQIVICVTVLFAVRLNRNFATIVLAVLYLILASLFAFIHFKNRSVLKFKKQSLTDNQ
ncbi:MraY family glycosyltransferase [Treponema pectinovorum]|uniref:MraY family glycosyltransferase n=1 Tax=Treponema pectinovorum TaxID=164 RepID=UPI0011F26500|nr:MraY family glycosyltransferase [Treponema pectinovorum]